MFVVSEPRQYVGQVVANGHSARFVQVVAGMPLTLHWRRGERVRNSRVPFGAVIATFGPNGRYQNKVGRSHAAVYLSQGSDGLRVLSQWQGKPVHERLIRWRGGIGVPSNDGDAFYVVEAPQPALEA